MSFAEVNEYLSMEEDHFEERKEDFVASVKSEELDFNMVAFSKSEGEKEENCETETFAIMSFDPVKKDD